LARPREHHIPYSTVVGQHCWNSVSKCPCPSDVHFLMWGMQVAVSAPWYLALPCCMHQSDSGLQWSLVKPRTALASQTVNLGWASLAWLPCCMRSLHGLRRLYGQGRRSRGWLPVSASGTRAAAVGCPLASMHVPTVFSDLEFVSPICVCSRSAADPFTFSFLTEPPSPS
jgi:hypothetical protein